MKLPTTLFLLFAIIVVVTSEPPVVRRPLLYRNWPAKNAKQIATVGRGGATAGKQRTLVVQIRSDQPVPLVLKGGRTGQLRHGPVHLRAPRPIKLTGPVYMKTAASSIKSQRKPLKIKLLNSKLKSKPATSYDVPFRFETPISGNIAYPPLGGDAQQLPLGTQLNYIAEHDYHHHHHHLQHLHQQHYEHEHAHTHEYEHEHEHFAPIHTIPAPNLSIPDNHLQEGYLPPKLTQSYQQSQSNNNNNQYQVVEELTNDQTIHDPLTGSQKLFAPDPDPSLPTAQIRPATEPFNQPSNGKPLPVDVQTNFLLPAQPLVQIVGAQEVVTPEIYPIQFTQQAQLQPLITANVASVQAAAVPIYDPTYLVTQSNQLYTQHQQQLFQPSASLIQAGYVNADLTQEVASDGQILQAAKDSHNNIHPVLDSAPQFAALIAAPVLGDETAAHYHHLPQAAALTAATNAPDAGFVVSNYYDGNAAQDNSQLLQAYAEEEAQRQQLEAEQEQQQLLLQQQHNHLLALQQQQQQQQHQQQQQQQQLQHLQQQQQQQRHQQPLDPAASAFEAHQRLVQQQLGADTPLRIFVPDDDLAAASDGRLQKRSDQVKKGTVEDANTSSVETTADDDLFEVSSSVEVSNENQKTETTSTTSNE